MPAAPGVRVDAVVQVPRRRRSSRERRPLGRALPRVEPVRQRDHSSTPRHRHSLDARRGARPPSRTAAMLRHRRSAEISEAEVRPGALRRGWRGSAPSSPARRTRLSTRRVQPRVRLAGDAQVVPARRRRRGAAGRTQRQRVRHRPAHGVVLREINQVAEHRGGGRQRAGAFAEQAEVARRRAAQVDRVVLLFDRGQQVPRRQQQRLDRQVERAARRARRARSGGCGSPSPRRDRNRAGPARGCRAPGTHRAAPRRRTRGRRGSTAWRRRRGRRGRPTGSASAKPERLRFGDRLVERQLVLLHAA